MSRKIAVSKTDFQTLRFESYVILDTTKTKRLESIKNYMFESYVILDTTKTALCTRCPSIQFESYVILDTTKTKGFT